MARAIKKGAAKKATSQRAVKKATLVRTGKILFRSDVKQTATLVKVGRTGAANAIRETKALGLPITYLQGGVLYKEYPDGRKEILAAVAVKKTAAKKTAKVATPLKKGMVLHAKK